MRQYKRKLLAAAKARSELPQQTPGFLQLPVQKAPQKVAALQDIIELDESSESLSDEDFKHVDSKHVDSKQVDSKKEDSK